MNITDLNKQYIKDSNDALDNMVAEYNKKYLNHQKVIMADDNGEREGKLLGMRRAKVWIKYNIEVLVSFNEDESNPIVYKPWQFDEAFIRFVD